ncbi:MAG: AIR carboxylase family protein, partial [Planctomycetota bacterium]
MAASGPPNGTQEGDQPMVGVIMGSTSDWDTMSHCAQMLSKLGVPHECR